MSSLISASWKQTWISGAMTCTGPMGPSPCAGVCPVKREPRDFHCDCSHQRNKSCHDQAVRCARISRQLEEEHCNGDEEREVQGRPNELHIRVGELQLLGYAEGGAFVNQDRIVEGNECCGGCDRLSPEPLRFVDEAQKECDQTYGEGCRGRRPVPFSVFAPPH